MPAAKLNAGESFFEFRLDYLPAPEQGIAFIRKFLAAHSDSSILATCRRHQNHGKFNGSIEEQIRILDAALDAGASAVDLEIESAENALAPLDALRAKGRLMLSYHNYDGTPSPEAVLRRMLRIPADAYKIVTTARKPSDNSRILELTKSHPRTPLVVLAMGETGFPTRVLSTAWGGLFTYAAPNASEGTASGQVTARSCASLYRVEKFSRAAKIYGVIADPVRHSISPAVHNRAFQAHRLDAVYLPFLVHPAQLKDFFVLAGKLPVAGFSVTIPHKQKVMRYLDVVDPLARRIGAVNTVWKKAGKWRGTNTDAEAVTDSAGPQAAPLQILHSVGRKWRRGPQRCLCADGERRQGFHGGPQSGPRAVARSELAEPSRCCANRPKSASSTPWSTLRRSGMYPHTDGCFFQEFDSRRNWSSTWYTTRSRPRCPPSRQPRRRP